MGISRGTVNNWFNETRDPTAESIPAIVAALDTLNPAAARDFLRLYLDEYWARPGDWINPLRAWVNRRVLLRGEQENKSRLKFLTANPKSQSIKFLKSHCLRDGLQLRRNAAFELVFAMLDGGVGVF